MKQKYGFAYMTTIIIRYATILIQRLVMLYIIIACQKHILDELLKVIKKNENQDIICDTKC